MKLPNLVCGQRVGARSDSEMKLRKGPILIVEIIHLSNDNLPAFPEMKMAPTAIEIAGCWHGLRVLAVCAPVGDANLEHF